MPSISNQTHDLPAAQWRQLLASDDDQLYVETSRQLAAAYFDLAASPEVKTAEDPESGESWQQARIQVRGTAASVQDAHRAYTNAWLKLVPAERARDVRLAIRIHG